MPINKRVPTAATVAIREFLKEYYFGDNYLCAYPRDLLREFYKWLVETGKVKT